MTSLERKLYRDTEVGSSNVVTEKHHPLNTIIILHHESYESMTLSREVCPRYLRGQ